MSFLDTVSAGFGAAFFLFIIFASLPIEKSSGMLGSEEYIQIELWWSSSQYNLDLVVVPPGGSHQRLYLDQRRSASGGAIIEDPITGKVGDLPGREKWQVAYINGTSSYGQSNSEVVRSSAGLISNSQRLSFRANGACWGDWQFFIAVKSNRNYLSHSSYTPIIVYGRAFTSAVESDDSVYKTKLILNDYLPSKYGNSRGGSLMWVGGPDKLLDPSELIRLKENGSEPMEYCN
jgi:hypothetical protein